MASSNPVSRGIVSKYFWYVYNLLPDFVYENQRHQGYYRNQNEQPEEENLIAYSIHKIDRSSENINNLFELFKSELINYVSKAVYNHFWINNEVNNRIASYQYIIEIDDFKELLTQPCNHADTATGIIYYYGDKNHFEHFNNTYGLDVNSLNEIICQYLRIDRYDPFYRNNSLSFWMRRNNENNMETLQTGQIKHLKTILKKC